MNLERIKTAFARAKRAVELRPSTARKTATCTVRVVDGYTCSMEEGRWRLVGDASEKVGGRGLGPDPSQLVRMAFGSCCAQSIVQWSAMLGIELVSLEVVVETDHDYGGFYDTKDTPAGPLAVRYRVTLESNAPESELVALLDKADRHSPLHDIFERPMKLSREIKIKRREN